MYSFLSVPEILIDAGAKEDADHEMEACPFCFNEPHDLCFLHRLNGQRLLKKSTFGDALRMRSR
jgi:hypothetical protein